MDPEILGVGYQKEFMNPKAIEVRDVGPVSEGSPAPGFRLPALDGTEISLEEARSGPRAVLLVFLRHLG